MSDKPKQKPRIGFGETFAELMRRPSTDYVVWLALGGDPAKFPKPKKS